VRTIKPAKALFTNDSPFFVARTSSAVAEYRFTSSLGEERHAIKASIPFDFKTALGIFACRTEVSHNNSNAETIENFD